MIGLRKYARNQLSLVDNQSVEDKFRRAEGKLRRVEKTLEGPSKNAQREPWYFLLMNHCTTESERLWCGKICVKCRKL